MAAFSKVSNIVMGLTPSPDFLLSGLTKPRVQISTASSGTLPLAQASAQRRTDSVPYGVFSSAKRCVLRPLALPGWAAFLRERRRLLTLEVMMPCVSFVVEILEACLQRASRSSLSCSPGGVVWNFWETLLKVSS